MNTKTKIAQNRQYRVVITKDEDGVYIADIPTLKHCISYGDTIEETIVNINDVLEGVLEVMQEEGLVIPDDSNIIEYSISKPILPSARQSRLVTAQ